MSAIALRHDFDPSRYNALGSIISADEFVREDSRIDGLLNHAAKLFLQHNACSVFGLGLLHRHHYCESGERMSQAARVVSGEEELVTRPVHDNRDYNFESPWLWAISDRKYYPLEFTSDPVARELFERTVEVPEGFFRELSELLDESPIGQMVGLAIIRRELHSRMPKDHTFLEYTYGDERESVIHVRHEDEAVGSIVTAWGFETRIDPISGCVEPATKCDPVYECYCRTTRHEDGRVEHDGFHGSKKVDHRQIRGQHNPSFPF
jgi:hypothetical protein